MITEHMSVEELANSITTDDLESRASALAIARMIYEHEVERARAMLDVERLRAQRDKMADIKRATLFTMGGVGWEKTASDREISSKAYIAADKELNELDEQVTSAKERMVIEDARVRYLERLYALCVVSENEQHRA